MRPTLDPQAQRLSVAFQNPNTPCVAAQTVHKEDVLDAASGPVTGCNGATTSLALKKQGPDMYGRCSVEDDSTTESQSFVSPQPWTASTVSWAAAEQHVRANSIEIFTHLRGLDKVPPQGQRLEQWNVAKVTDMSWLFQDVDFKEDISAGNRTHPRVIRDMNETTRATSNRRWQSPDKVTGTRHDKDRARMQNGKNLDQCF
ncbi:hypothetical protein AK812_SmicGene36737 [Symbiodinium microadriaticum]|uniref:Uncharacterized protein n=1 Tax=Symbiodinium microadriaticum TaxID=2951 RepID=A0A1Q9CI41_SYMMI|nr:hypothetical protein AK812_SmicGene36737 [Symbiodinium microadriaticum]CAE7914685.1 unnamed protein product [Symbiodinium sp. KB8]